MFHYAIAKIIDASLTLHWHSILGCGNEHVICVFQYNANRYIDFGRMWQCSPLIAECERQKIIDNLSMLTFITSKQPFNTQSLYATNYIHIIDIQYCVCMYYRLYPGILLPLNFWSTAIHTIWVRDEVVRSHSHTFGRQFEACWTFH
jgi:hypothetical protein